MFIDNGKLKTTAGFTCRRIKQMSRDWFDDFHNDELNENYFKIK